MERTISNPSGPYDNGLKPPTDPDRPSSTASGSKSLGRSVSNPTPSNKPRPSYNPLPASTASSSSDRGRGAFNFNAIKKFARQGGKHLRLKSDSNAMFLRAEPLLPIPLHHKSAPGTPSDAASFPQADGRASSDSNHHRNNSNKYGAARQEHHHLLINSYATKLAVSPAPPLPYSPSLRPPSSISLGSSSAGTEMEMAEADGGPVTDAPLSASPPPANSFSLNTVATTSSSLGVLTLSDSSPLPDAPVGRRPSFRHENYPRRSDMASGPPANASASTSTPTPTPPATSASDPFLVTSPTSIVPPSSDALPNPSSSDTFPTASTTGTTNTTEAVEDILDTRVPSILQEGTEMIKVSAKQAKRRMFCLHADVGQIHWPSKKTGVLMIDNIKEIRTGPETQLHRDQLRIQLPADANRDFWITIIYTTEAKYKTLHMIAYSAGEFELWSSTLRRLFAFRRYLLNGLVGPSVFGTGSVSEIPGGGEEAGASHVMEHRDEMWQKRYWKDTDQSGDQRADFPEIERLCRRLNISSSRANLLNVFTEADSQSKGWLSFPDFKHFVRLLKARPDIDMLFEMLQGEEHDHFSFHVFEHFMQTCQHSTHSRAQLIKTFNKFAPREEEGSRPNRDVVPGPASARTTLDEETVATNSEMGSQADPVPSPNAWTLASFTAFLLSSDNSPYSLTDSGFTHDMTRPLSEYFISSSHNTYLVGHQLVGDSTVEGYIRALLQGCRSVEIDIWDGDDAPVICHGRTLTTKVSLTDVARAIARYAFVASPYPLIISAEIHCSVKQQDMAADIMKREFGDMLVTKTLDGTDTIEALPSPEMLKGRILIKAKNLYASQDGQIQTYMPTVHSESSSAEDDGAEASEFDAIKRELKHIPADIKAGIHDVKVGVKDIKADLKGVKAEFERKGPKKWMEKAKSVVHPASGSSSDSKAAAATTNNTLAPPVLFSDSSASHSMSRSSSQDKSRSRAASSSSQNGGKPKMSMALAELIVYTVGVKCRGFNKKEHYAVEHLFSLSERTANKILKESSGDLVKHNRTHLVRIYPNGMRLNSSNYEPHRYWACGSQIVAINWQTLDLGYVMNHAMFQRNGRAGYVLKPDALRIKDKEFIKKRTKHFLDITIISAQQLPRPDLVFGKEADTRHTIDPYVEVSLHVPDWSTSPFLPSTPQAAPAPALPNASPSSSTSSLAPVSPAGSSASPARTISATTQVVKNNGWNPTWNSQMHIPFDCVGEMMDLIFVRLQVKDQHNDAEIALFCAPLGSLRPGFRHLPLHDKQLSQFLFSTLFVQIGVRDVTNANP